MDPCWYLFRPLSFSIALTLNVYTAEYGVLPRAGLVWITCNLAGTFAQIKLRFTINGCNIHSFSNFLFIQEYVIEIVTQQRGRWQRMSNSRRSSTPYITRHKLQILTINRLLELQIVKHWREKCNNGAHLINLLLAACRRSLLFLLQLNWWESLECRCQVINGKVEFVKWYDIGSHHDRLCGYWQLLTDAVNWILDHLL